MSKKFLTPVVIDSGQSNTSGFQLVKLVRGGDTTLSAPLGVDAAGNVVLAGHFSQSSAIADITSPVTAYTFTMPFTGAMPGMDVRAQLSGYFANGAYPDEYEMEPMAVYGVVLSANTIAFTVTCTDSSMFTIGKKTNSFQFGVN